MAGLLLYLAAGIPYAVSGLVAPPAGVALLWVLWVAGLAVAIRLFRARSPWIFAMPFAALAMWWVTLTVGDIFLGWVA